jgi:hypothetical protein
VKNEGEAFGGVESIENDQQSEADRVGHHSFLFGIDSFRNDAWWHCIGRLRGERFFSTRRARAEHVETYPRDNGRQPAAEVVDGSGIRAAETKPSFLNRVVGLSRRAKHAVRDTSQVSPILFEFFRQPILFSCHKSSRRSVMVVTEWTSSL